jgi:UDP:flavonoid glycosyltransferase YjiC (YdhE family)
MIRPREVSKNALIEGVRSISNDPLLRGQVKRMQTETHKAGGAKKAVEVIEDWLKK